MPKIPIYKKRFWERPAKTKIKKESNNQKFYESTAWRKLRKMHVSKNPYCVECAKQGRYIPVQQVDHIVAIEFGGAKLDPDNLQSLCYSCHGKKSAAEKHAKQSGTIDQWIASLKKT